jgi:hypothetical protein
MQEMQAAYDASYWEHNATKDDKIRHILLHLCKSLGKMSGYCEAREHGKEASTDIISQEVARDLLIHAMQLFNLLGLRADTAYVQRLKDNMTRLHGTQP